MEASLNSYMQDTCTDHHPEDDTLSLSDLPIYGESVDHDQDSRVDDQALDDDDFPKGDQQAFEFFSGEWGSTTATSFPSTTTTTTTTTPAAAALDPNVVFCGKTIPNKLETSTPATYENTLAPELIKKRRKRRYITLSWWSFTSLSKSRPVKSTDSASQRYLYKGEKEIDGKNNENQAGKVPIVVAPTKSKWYLYVFGLSRVQTKMHVGDLRRRHGSSTSLRSSGSVSASRDINGSKSGEDASGKGLGWWALIRVLGCAGGDGVDHHHAAAVVTANHGLANEASV